MFCLQMNPSCAWSESSSHLQLFLIFPPLMILAHSCLPFVECGICTELSTWAPALVLHTNILQWTWWSNVWGVLFPKSLSTWAKEGSSHLSFLKHFQLQLSMLLSWNVSIFFSTCCHIIVPIFLAHTQKVTFHSFILKENQTDRDAMVSEGGLSNLIQHSKLDFPHVTLNACNV
jgi:hypothetical protein